MSCMNFDKSIPTKIGAMDDYYIDEYNAGTNQLDLVGSQERRYPVTGLQYNTNDLEKPILPGNSASNSDGSWNEAIVDH